MTIDNDDALLDALSRGEAPPPGDDVAMLMAAWHSELADVSPAVLRPAQPARSSRSSRSGSPRRFSRPLVVALATVALAFGGLTVASAKAEPGSALWPLTQLLWSERAESKTAEAQARELLRQAREALAQNRPREAVQLIVRAAEAIDRITDPVVRQQLKQEAIDLLGQVGSAPAAPAPSAGSGTFAPATAPQQPPQQPAGTPTPTRKDLLPPLLPGLLPSILPTWLPSLPLIK